MGSRDTVGGILHAKIPSLYRTSKTFTFADGDCVNPLSDLEVPRTEVVANRKHVLLGDLELSKVTLWRNVVLKEVTYLRLGHFVGQNFTTADLNRINTIMFHCLNLGHLAAVQLYDGTGLEFAPFVPKVSHTDFVTEHAHPR